VARKPAEFTVSRRDILMAAAAVLHEKGYHRTKMEEIAKAVDLTAGSLYHHFPNGKQEILIAVLTDGLDEITRGIEEVYHSQLSPKEKFRRAVHLHVTGITSNVSVGAAMVFEIRNMLDLPQIREAYVRRRDAFEKLFRHIIQEGIDQGAFQPVEVKLFVRMMLGSHNWVGVWYRDGGPLKGEHIAEQMADWFLCALEKNEASSLKI
jgi:TetR/AcrR family transcriptional regulator, cholesterol catabolism regulator